MRNADDSDGRLGRRAFLAATGATGLGATAGCLGVLETERANREPPLPENRPDAPYVPTHIEGMHAAGTASNGRYRVALSYTFPHRFWLVRGTDTDRVNAKGADDVHLMVSVWDAEDGVVLPAVGPQVELAGPDGETTTVNPWQMLSQQMGVHFGDNVTLGPQGEYEATVTVTPGATRRAESVETPDGPLSFSLSFTYSHDVLEDLSFEDIPSDREGTPGAVEPMGMPFVQQSRVPAADSFPVSVLGTATTGGASLVVGAADERGRFAGASDESYLVASLRTPHSRFPLPATALEVDVERDGETRHSGPLVGTLDPELGHHYGAVVPSLRDADGVTVRVTTPVQLARHEGYETAFFEFEDVTV